MKVKRFSRIILILGFLFLLSFIAYLTLLKDKVIIIKNVPLNVTRLDKFKSNADDGKNDSIKIIVYEGLRNSLTVELSSDQSKVITFTSDATNSKNFLKDAIKIHSIKCSKLVKGNEDTTINYFLMVKDKKEIIQLASFKK
jgi:hypothetical protein